VVSLPKARENIDLGSNRAAGQGCGYSRSFGANGHDPGLRWVSFPVDIHLAAQALADQLGGKHPKRAAVVLGVLKDGLNTAEVDPLAILADDTD
jgi:hypothetical protein